MSDPSLLLVDGRLADGTRVDIAVVDGIIEAIAAPGEMAGKGGNAIDLDGRLLLPGLIDGHLHLDKTFLGHEWVPHAAGPSVKERIDNEVKVAESIALSVAERAANLVELAVAKGTTSLRTHADVDPDKGLEHVRILTEVREKYRDVVAIEIVAFPQQGVLARPGTAELLEAATAAGADRVGGLDPATIDGDVAGQLDRLFAVAERRGVGIDIHLHDGGLEGVQEIEQMATRTEAHGLQGRVTVSHAYCLGQVDDGIAKRTAERMARAGIDVVTAAPGALPMPPIDVLRAAGVRVFAGSDNIRDAWSPFGNADMLERAMLIAYRLGWRRDEEIATAFEMVTAAGAAALGLCEDGVAVGAPADLIALPARSVPEAIAERTPCRLVIKAGRVVARDGEFIGPGSGAPAHD
jgi:cytosine deaminase